VTTIHLGSISGGADSLATVLLAKERAERRGLDLRLINADLGENENPLTHEYIGYLEAALGMPILRVRADFTAEFAVRRAAIHHHWSREKRRKEHTAPCKGRRAAIPPVISNCRPSAERRDALKAWVGACDCPERVSPPVPQEIIDQAKALLVPTGEPFLDVCMLKGRFPSRKAQFCTERLKLEPINAVVHPLLDAGHTVVSWIGERAEESDERAAKPAFERIRWATGGGNLVLWRPIHKWTKPEAFALAKRHGIKPNPLYQMGMGRVGCFCVNATKGEVAQVDRRFPEVIERISTWQGIVAAVSRRQSATFFAGTASDPLSGDIRRVVEWAKTSRGGKQFSLLDAIARAEDEERGPMCESAYGLCE
jgi:3'-phosphoadenosine 5'-phosphosulfate sulfotransferase (PAPS reductase)/FAD synthetase